MNNFRPAAKKDRFWNSPTILGLKLEGNFQPNVVKLHGAFAKVVLAA